MMQGDGTGTLQNGAFAPKDFKDAGSASHQEPLRFRDSALRLRWPSRVAMHSVPCGPRASTTTDKIGRRRAYGEQSKSSPSLEIGLDSVRWFRTLRIVIQCVDSEPSGKVGWLRFLRRNTSAVSTPAGDWLVKFLRLLQIQVRVILDRDKLLQCAYA